MATTTTSTLSNTIKSYYDRVLLDALDPKLVYYQFATKKPLPKGEGTSVIWNRPQRIDLGYVLSEGVPVALSAGYALSTQTVSAIIREFGGWTVVTSKVDMTSIADVMKMAAERLGAQAGETIERVMTYDLFLSASDAATHTSAHHLYKTSTGVFEYWGAAVSAPKNFDATLVSGLGVIAQAVSSANVLAVSDIRTAVYKLKSLNVPPYEGNDYMAIVNVETAEDIVSDSTWIGFHQYVNSGVENIYRGEIGKVYGCRFVETTQGPAVRAIPGYTSTNSAIAYGTVIMGKGFYGATELDGGIKTYISQGASKFDPLNQVTTYGWRGFFTCKLLNTSAGIILWAGSNDTTTAAAESAGSGTRDTFPSAE